MFIVYRPRAYFRNHSVRDFLVVYVIMNLMNELRSHFGRACLFFLSSRRSFRLPDVPNELLENNVSVISTVCFASVSQFYASLQIVREYLRWMILRAATYTCIRKPTEANEYFFIQSGILTIAYRRQQPTPNSNNKQQMATIINRSNTSLTSLSRLQIIKTLQTKEKKNGTKQNKYSFRQQKYILLTNLTSM